MSTTTKNFNLIKPNLSDPANIDDFNANWDAIDEELQKLHEETSAEYILEQNEKAEQKFWVGTKNEYDALETKDPNTTYIVTDEGDALDVLYTSGGVMTGALKVAGLILTEGKDFGTVFPTSAVVGQAFLKKVNN